MFAPAGRRKGLTLMELIVVMVILIALAGILVPMLPNMITRAHTSSGATNSSEINKFVQTYQSIYLSYPDQWDALSDGTNLISYFPGGASQPGILSGNLTAAELKALNNAGLTTVHYLTKDPAADPWTPTFNPYVTPMPDPGTLLTTSTTVALLDPALAQTQMGLSPTGKYVVFGFGRRSTMVGKVTSDPPTHFGDNPNLNAANRYSRFCVVFKVSDTAPGVVINNAPFVGSISLHDDGIGTTDSHLEEYFNTTKAQ